MQPFLRLAVAWEGNPHNVPFKNHRAFVAADNNPKPAAVSEIAHFYLHAGQDNGFAVVVACDANRLVMRRNPADFQARQQIRCRRLQKATGDLFTAFTAWQRLACQIQRNMGKAFQRAVSRYERAEMLTAQTAVCALSATASTPARLT